MELFDENRLQCSNRVLSFFDPWATQVEYSLLLSQVLLENITAKCL